MYRLYGNSLHDQAKAHHLRVIVPGEPEPLWLRHSVEVSSALAEIRAEAAAAGRKTEPRPGFVTRLRVVLGLA